MPSPKDARKTSAKQSPATKEADLGQTLAKRKSQDFKSKIAEWNGAGAGVAEDAGLDANNAEGVNAKVKGKGVVKKEKPSASAEIVEDKENATPASPKVPQTPALGDKGVGKQISARKASREIDSAKKAWVRRRSKPQPEGSPELSPEATPDANAKGSPNLKPKASPNVKQVASPSAKPKVLPKMDLEDSKDAVKSATPKKRIVSDSNWRKDRVGKSAGTTPIKDQAKDEDTTPAKTKATDKEKEKETTQPKGTDKLAETTPKPRIVRRSVVSVGLRVPPSVHDFKENSQQRPVRVRPLRRRSRSLSGLEEGEEATKDAPDFESSSVKIYVKKRRRSKGAEHANKDRKAFNTSESSLTVHSSLDQTGSLTDITTPDATPTKDRTPRVNTAPKIKTVRRSRNDTPALDKADDPISDANSPRGAVERTSRARGNTEDDGHRPLRSSKFKDRSSGASKIPAGQEAESTPQVYGSRIEGWLANMPDDPFVEPSPPSQVSDTPVVSRKTSRPVDDFDRGERSGLRKSSDRRERPKTSPEHRNMNDSSPPADAATSIGQWLNGAAQSLGLAATRQTPVKDRLIRASDTQDMENVPPRDFRRHRSKRHAYGEVTSRYVSDGSHRVPPSLAKPKGPRVPSSGFGRYTSFPEESVVSRASDRDEPPRHSNIVRRGKTQHTDLMSVLSLSRDDDHDPTSRRSTRSRRRRREVTTVGDLMNDISTEELKYQRELRTLVDGVIPVLLQYVISQNDAATKSSSSQSPRQNAPAVTQPIVEMGVALERLKATHRRIPMHNANELLLWAQSTSKVYGDYLKVWRSGFNDIVVNLAPAEKQATPAWDRDLQRNAHGDLLDTDGERVDVAFLLKRPLVRIKSLSKTIKGICQTRPSSLADDVAAIFEDLVTQAKQRNNDERARLEDEAASAIDPGRARDPRNLAPLGGVSIDPTRRVRARDFFDMELFHSNGQQLGCRIETIIRDGVSDRNASGDILFCEISPAGRWLLFPPVLVSNVSARRGDKDGEIVAMIRGLLQDGSEWREVMSLRSSEPQGAEWLDMLASTPMPPRLTRQSSFNALRGSRTTHDIRTSSTDTELPIGEQVLPGASQWDGSDVNSISNGFSPSNGLTATTPGALPEKLTTFAKEHSWSLPKAPEAGRNYRDRASLSPTAQATHTRSRSDWIRPTQETGRGVRFTDHELHGRPSSADEREQPKEGHAVRQRTSSVPSMDLPTVNKLRNGVHQETPNKGSNNRESSAPARTPASAPNKLQTRQLPAGPRETPKRYNHTSDTRSESKGGVNSIPSLTPTFLQRHRRTSSPLKHEYEPSTGSGTPSRSEYSDVSDDESITSESSLDEAVSTLGELQDFSKFGAPRPHVRSSRQPPPPPPLSTGGDTVDPSESASQAPYRTVPPTRDGSTKSVASLFSWSDKGAWSSMHPEECELVITPGLIEAFDLAQAHAARAINSGDDAPSPSARGVKPLVALELTPWVPLRRGTAVDISIRSPPTSNSVLRNGNNIMFRSRSPEDCEKLYNLINRARIDNPTWIALQNARPKQTSNWAEVMERRNAERTDTHSGSFLKTLSRKSTTYRSKGTRSASIAGSQSTTGSLNSAFSAIRQFSGGSRIFNIAKSTIMSKQSTRSSYSDSLSSGAATPLPVDPSIGTPVGISNAKIRLYLRETTTKWKDLGNGRLTIVLPPRRDPSIPADPRTTGLEKRVLVCGDKGTTLLDVTLGENCFERIARTGIAVSVWEEGIGPNGELGHVGATGGVVSSKSKVYMIQMKSERDAAYTFSIVGKLRY